ncbi:hypothetical protein RJT34_32308 [Clitoria ternatea]|uniref:DNA-directed RNA polymerase II subunit RPB9-like zinc ribbon domain-containing protein n=1 Tax=Clitoria ternatea TaxID=43366 RepID=A0AAN9I262_CLITE
MSTLKFCRKCNNVMFPKDDKERKILLYACGHCDHEEVADSNIVYRTMIHHPDQQGTQEPKNAAIDPTIPRNIAEDPTLPRTKNVRCSQCNHGEAVFFERDGEVKRGLLTVIGRLSETTQDEDLAIVELGSYRMADGLFGSATAIRHRSILAPSECSETMYYVGDVLKFLNVCRHRHQERKVQHSILFAATQSVTTDGETRTLPSFLKSRFNFEAFSISNPLLLSRNETVLCKTWLVLVLLAFNF